MNIEDENTYKKFQEVPSSTSTPNSRTISARKSIHPDNSVSPIIRSAGHNVMLEQRPSGNQQRSKSEIRSDSGPSDNSSSEGDSPKSYSHESSSKYSHESSSYIVNKYSNQTVRRTENPNGQTLSRKVNFNVIYGCLSFTAALSALIAICASVMSSENTTVSTNSVTIEELQDYFPLQSEDVWNALETGINEVKNFNKPSVFLLLYEDEATETLNYMLKNISKYASCVLNANCEIQPIVLTSTILETEKARTDYGYVIAKYKPELEKRRVMIVKNLDRIPGDVAQAFHSMCDEFTPLVEKTVFFFTVRIENLQKSSKRDLQIIEEVLRNNWSDLDDDIFYPLFTRISNMVLRIVPEKR